MGYTMDMSKEKEAKELLPEGWRKFLVEDVEEKISKKGNPMLVWHIRDIATRQLEDVYTVMEQGKRWLLKKALAACAVPVADGEIYTFELADLKNIEIDGKVKHEMEEWINKKGETVTTPKGKIVDFRLPGSDAVEDGEKNADDINF